MEQWSVKFSGRILLEATDLEDARNKAELEINPSTLEDVLDFELTLHPEKVEVRRLGCYENS